jgi:hypothetical protein
MTNTNARIYGPPSHKPTRFTVHVEARPMGGWSYSLQATALTKVGLLWSVKDAGEVEDQPYAHLIMATELERVMGDLLRDLPGTEQRARFVISGGLWHQPELPL